MGPKSQEVVDPLIEAGKESTRRSWAQRLSLAKHVEKGREVRVLAGIERWAAPNRLP